MLVAVNGKPQDVPAGCTIDLLLEMLDIRVKHVAVERNKEVVPREQHAATRLSDGDQLEVVTLVGGG